MQDARRAAELDAGDGARRGPDVEDQFVIVGVLTGGRDGDDDLPATLDLDGGAGQARVDGERAVGRDGQNESV